MELNSLHLLKEYRSDKNNLVDDFFIPCLSRSIIYKRAVGYFTSNSLALVAKGLAEFIHYGGTMQLIASPYLTEQDVKAIELGYRTRNEVVSDALLRQLSNVEENIVKNRLAYLAKLIASERLEIKIAMLRDSTVRGIYHEKLGIFQDALNNVVCFSGSANETESSMYNNFEQIDVFCSWRLEDSERSSVKIQHFNELWLNSIKHLEVISFTKAVEKGFLQFEKYLKPVDPESRSLAITNKFATAIMRDPAIPENMELRDYQKSAIKSWFRHEGSGIFEMATGTGKTVTALSTSVLLYQHLLKLALIIVCPYSQLVEQWAGEAKRFNFSPILAFDSKKKWEEELNRQIISYNVEGIDSFCVITTNKTFISALFQTSIRRLIRPAMLIVDEAHHIGADEAIKQLPDKIQYRLALSATPQRWMDEEGTKKINDYFTPGVVFTFGLKEAIGKYLTEYYYYPHLVELTEEENEEYHLLTKKIARVSNFGKRNMEIEPATEPALRNLLIKRAKLIGRARNKTEMLRNLVQEKKESKFNIFYCGDEKVDGVRQLEEVMLMLGQEVGMKVHPFTSEESHKQRKYILDDFESGKLQGLVAIRCLDEGVDIPATQTAYILASSNNPREFIQRRGRILRKHPNKKFAYIHDFLVVPRNLKEVQYMEPSLFNTERALMLKELQRASEFAELAYNSIEARSALLDVKLKYNLLDM